jgi:hypothetical protein
MLNIINHILDVAGAQSLISYKIKSNSSIYFSYGLDCDIYRYLDLPYMTLYE